jgi:lipoprotein-releasing system ATP-binding protein
LQVLGTLDVPTGGEVLYGRVNPFALADRQRAAFRRRHMGFVFQFHHLLPQFTALENVAMPGRIDRLAREEAESRAEQLLRRMGLGHRLSHRPGELSGGEQQRVAVARALLMRPKIVLADEPTGNLDVTTGEGIHDLLLELNQEFGMAMVIVTHNPGLARRLPRQLQMVDGVLREGDAVESVVEVTR